MEPALPSGNAGISSRRSLRAGRIYRCLYRDLQRRPRRHEHEVHRSSLNGFESGVVMKRIAVWSAAVFTVWAIAAQTQSESHQEAQKVFRGEVSDSQCALNIHSLTRSHQEMLKSKSMGGTATSCSVYCIEHLGGYLVLSSGKDVFRLDRADLVHGFEGQKVKLTGVLNAT